MSTKEKGKKRFNFDKMPHTYAIISAVIIIACILTWVIPSGTFDYETVEINGVERSVPVEGSFHFIEKTSEHKVGLMGFLTSFQDGIIYNSDLMALIFIVSGAFYVIVKTGAFHALIASTLRKFNGQDKILLAICFCIFAAGGTLFGMLNEFNGFYPLFVGLAIALGYDAVFGMAIMTLGMDIGFAVGIMNPYTVVVGQSIAGLPIYSGAWYRCICLVVLATLALFWVFRYGNKVRKDPSKSVMLGIESKYAFDKSELDQYQMATKNKLIIAEVAIGIVVLMYGFLNLDWGTTELTGVFILLAFIAAMLDRQTVSEFCDEFLTGCENVVFGALIVGVAAAILLVMEKGMIVDTIIYYAGNAMMHVPTALAAEAMLILQTFLNFFIPSGSGQAATIMPIMAPIADMVGLSRQVAVLAYQFGDGLSNTLWPTCGIMVSCGLAGVPIDRWWKFFLPLFGLMFIAASILLAIAVAIGL